MKKQIFKIIENPFLLLYYCTLLVSKLIFSDKFYLKLLFFYKLREKLDFTQPKTFNQKIQWLKLNNKLPIYTKMVDKYECREIVSQQIGDEYLIPLLGVWDKFDDINFDLLPQQFVLKTTHDSGTVIVCKDKKAFNYQRAKRILSRSLKRNYFYVGREYPYKNIKSKIIAEKYMLDSKEKNLNDFKYFCFNGIPEILFYASERYSRDVPYFDYYDMNLQRLDIRSCGHENNPLNTLPINIHELVQMQEIVKKLIHNINIPSFIRIDLYLVDNKIYFGEFTFHHDGGLVGFIPKKWDLILGEKIILKNENYN